MRLTKKTFQHLGSVLNQVVSQLGLDKRLCEHTLFELWPSLIGEPWASRSKPVFIDSERKLVVSVADAATGQELSLLKSNILSKLKIAGHSLGVEISGIRFDLKYFHIPKQNENSSQYANPVFTMPDVNLNEISLSDDDQAELLRLKTSLANVLSSEPIISCKRILTVFEKKLKLRQWKKQKGFPICSACQEPVAYLHGAEKLCQICFWASR